MADKQTDNFFMYRFLIDSRYRIYRHLLLIVAMFFVALNQSNVVYEEHRPEVISCLFLSTIAVMVSYLATVYYNLYVSIPKYLFAGRYFKYIIHVGLSIAILVILLDLIELGTLLITGVPLSKSDILNSGESLLIDFIFTFSLLTVCISGGAATSLLRKWNVENKNILQLKNDYLQSEIEQLKERISPDFLFSTLNNAGKLSISNPEESSSILVKLSRILRYQLYDFTHETVLLGSEITFIQNYLDLYRSQTSDFKFDITVEGESKRTFVPPLLFLPLIQTMIKKERGRSSLIIKFIVTDNSINFMCYMDKENCNDGYQNYNLENLHRRLKFLYNNAYALTVTNEQIVLQLNRLEW